MDNVNQMKVVHANKSIFNKAVSKISKLFVIPTQKGRYSVYIALRRKELIKSFNLVNSMQDDVSEDKVEEFNDKYEKTYEDYMKTIDKYITEYLYKKVSKQTANQEEAQTLAQYYKVMALKEDQYIEYKYKKQQFLINNDWETVYLGNNQNLIDNYKVFYVNKMDLIYKSLLKHYSVRLTDSASEKKEIYDEIFANIEEYIQNILPYKMEIDKKDEYNKVMSQYNKLVLINKYNLPTEQKEIEKRMILLGISRELFTHSLPLIAAEKCYISLIKETRKIIETAKTQDSKKLAYKLFIKIVEEYNCKLLSKKVYWDNSDLREEYKEFWNKYTKIAKLKETEEVEYEKQKEILFVKYDLLLLRRAKKDTSKIVRYYKKRLVELGAIRQIKDKINNKYNQKYIKKLI